MLQSLNYNPPVRVKSGWNLTRHKWEGDTWWLNIFCSSPENVCFSEVNDCMQYLYQQEVNDGWVIWCIL